MSNGDSVHSRYLASISHEMRAPLNAIYGYAQLLERGAAIDPAATGRTIRRSAEHLTNLVEGILDMSLVDHGPMKLSRDLIALGPFVEQITGMFAHEAEAKGLSLVFEQSGQLPACVRTDQNRLRQILINLLSNAIKFTPRGSVFFRVEHRGETATFEISDTGPGIPPEDRARIFEPFERGSDPAARAQPGSGLGLAITQALSRILGGELVLDDRPGGGSRFRLRLLLTPVADPPATAITSGTVTGYGGQRRAILVVDDDPDQLALLSALLEPLGFRVATAPRGEEAIAAARSDRFDLALVDVAMPGLSGWDTAAALAAVEAPPRILMLSGNALERHHSGADAVHRGFIVKPVALDTLLAAIAGQLGLSWTFAERAPAPVPSAVAQPALPAAAAPHVERLRELLEIGHVRGIEAAIRAIGEAAPEADSLVRRLFAHLDRFDFAALSRELEGDR